MSAEAEETGPWWSACLRRITGDSFSFSNGVSVLTFSRDALFNDPPSAITTSGGEQVTYKL